jgi:hypothetical protein
MWVHSSPDGGSTGEDCCSGDGKKHIDGLPGSGNSQQLAEVVIDNTRTGTRRDFYKDLTFIPKNIAPPILDFAIAPRYSDDWWWNKIPFSYDRYVEFSGPNDYGLNFQYTVNYEGYAIKKGGLVAKGSSGALGLIGPGSSFKIVSAYKNAISLFKGNKLLTNVGRAVTKHPQYFGFESTEALMKVHKTPQALNNLGSSTLKNIIRNGVKTTGAGGRYPNGWVTYTLQSGNAASWGADGSFIGFRGGGL